MSATASLAVTHLVPLAASDLDKNKVTPGVLGFIVFALIGGAVWLLMKSMNKHMRKVDFDEPGESGTATPAENGATKDGAPKGGATKGGTAQREAAQSGAAAPAAASKGAQNAKGVKGAKGATA